MTDSMFIELAFESFNYQVQTISMEYSNVCTDSIAEMTNALEVYETAYLVGVYECVNESKDTKHFVSVCEGNIRDFFDKIIQAIKKVVGKLKDAAALIGKKIKALLDAIKEKFGNIKSWVYSKVNPKRIFKDGFKISFSKGLDEYIEFCDANQNVLHDLKILTMDLLEKCMSDIDDNEIRKWFEQNAEKMSKYKNVKDDINNEMKSSVKFGDSMEDWCREAFEYKQMSENWVPSNKDASEMIKECNIYLTFLNTNSGITGFSDLVYSSCSMMNDFCKEIERTANRIGNNNPNIASRLWLLSKHMISYSEFGITVDAAVFQYTNEKFVRTLNYLKTAKLAVEM